MDELKALKAFRTVSRCGSFTVAARQLGMTTAAVSKSVARLEERLQMRLFNRDTRQVMLTDEGRLFLEQVSPALDTLEESMDSLLEHRRQPEGIISIATATSFGKEHLLQHLLGFLTLYPRIAMEVRFDDRHVNLIKEEYDLSLQFRSPTEQSYVSRRLCELPLLLVASPQYLSRNGVPGTVAELANHECITVRQASGQLGTWQLQQPPTGTARKPKVFTFTPTGRLLITGEYDAVLDSALAGHGITATYAHSVLRYLDSGELKVVLPDYRLLGEGVESTQIYLCYPHREYISYNVRTLIDYLVDSFKEFPPLKLKKTWLASPPDKI